MCIPQGRTNKISDSWLHGQALTADTKSTLAVFSQQPNQIVGLKQLLLGSSRLCGWQGNKDIHSDLSIVIHAK